MAVPGDRITDTQRKLARWLIDHGVDLVVGSHPHCVQPLDFYHGCPIAYSLGNLVFDGALTVDSWNRGALLEIGLNENAQASSARLFQSFSKVVSLGSILHQKGKLSAVVDFLSSCATCVKINAPWLCDCRNRIIRTSSESLSSISCARLKPRR